MTKERTFEDAKQAAADSDPIALHRLLTANASLEEAGETYSAASRRRAEAVVDLIEAGVSYADVGRLLGVGRERVRQLAAAHLGVSVADLNPKEKQAVNRH